MTAEAMGKLYPAGRAVRVQVEAVRPTCPAWSTYTQVWLVSTRTAAGEYIQDHIFPTWADAMGFADRLARFIRTSHQITEERQ